MRSHSRQLFLACSLAAMTSGIGWTGEPLLLEPPPHRPPYVPRIACYARPSDDGHYRGDYVGGGCACRGELRRSDEGTFGWDYQGCLLPLYPFLKWCHCGRYQGGAGAYKTDGPKFPGTPHTKESAE